MLVASGEATSVRISAFGRFSSTADKCQFEREQTDASQRTSRVVGTDSTLHIGAGTCRSVLREPSFLREAGHIWACLTIANEGTGNYMPDICLSL